MGNPLESVLVDLRAKSALEAEKRGTEMGKKLGLDLFPRNISVPNGFAPQGRVKGLYKSVWVRAMRELMSASLEDVPPSAKASFSVAASMAKWKSPVYFISEPVVRALMATSFPKDMRIDEVLWPLPVATFFLPKGAFQDPEGRGVSTLSWSVTKAGERVSYGEFPIAFSPERWVFNLLASVIREGASEGDLVYETTLAGETTLESMQSSPREVLMDPGTGRIITDGPAVARLGGFTVDCAELVLKIVLLMVARQDFVEEQKAPSRRAKFKNGKQVHSEIWQPNFVGKGYSIPVSGGSGKGEGRASPRLHLRHGYIRTQHFGEGNQKTKLMFIGPTWVGVDFREAA